jgi:hypothetical protein
MGEVVGIGNTGCAILIPSLNRPQRLLATIDFIHSSTPEPHKIAFCVSDPESMAILDRAGEWYLNDADDPDHRYVTRMNKLVRHIDGAETIFFGSDDVIHHPGWLTKALQVMDGTGAQVVVVNDAHNPTGTQAVMDRRYLPLAVFDSPGDAFHAGYFHNFADNEQHFTAHKRGLYARSMESIVEHLHPLFKSHNAIPWDETYRVGAMSNWDHDERLFKQRAKMIDAAIQTE